MEPIYFEIDVSHWQDSLEDAYLTVKSPTGTTVTIKKSSVFMNRKLTAEHSEVLKSLTDGNHYFTVQEWSMIVEMSKF